MLLNSVYQTCTQEKLINQNNRNQWLSISDASHALTYSTALLQFQDWRVGTNLRKSYRIVPLLKYPKIPHRQECVWKTLNKVYPLKKDKNIGIQGPVNAEQEGASPCRWGINFRQNSPKQKIDKYFTFWILRHGNTNKCGEDWLYLYGFPL